MFKDFLGLNIQRPGISMRKGLTVNSKSKDLLTGPRRTNTASLQPLNCENLLMAPSQLGRRNINPKKSQCEEKAPPTGCREPRFMNHQRSIS